MTQLSRGVAPAVFGEPRSRLAPAGDVAHGGWYFPGLRGLVASLKLMRPRVGFLGYWCRWGLVMFKMFLRGSRSGPVDWGAWSRRRVSVKSISSLSNSTARLRRASATSSGAAGDLLIMSSRLSSKLLISLFCIISSSKGVGV